MGGAPEFAAIISCYSEILGRDSKDPNFQTPETAALIAEAADLLQKCKWHARSLKLARPTRGLPSFSFTLAPPSREVADEMAKLYCESFESTWVENLPRICGLSFL